MLEGWEIAEASKQKAAEFGRKCDWCGRRGITHFVIGNKQHLVSMVCHQCFKKKGIKEIGGPTIVKKPYRWADSQKKKKAVLKSK